MLKAYAVALALTSTSPAVASTDVEVKQLDNQSLKTEVTQGFKPSGNTIISSDSAEAKKKWKRRGFIIIPR